MLAWMDGNVTSPLLSSSVGISMVHLKSKCFKFGTVLNTGRAIDQIPI